MTRWLEAAKREVAAGKKPNLPKKPPAPEVNSVNSVNSRQQEAGARQPEAPSAAPYGRGVGGRPLTELGGIIPGSRPGQSLADALAAPPPPVARTPEAIEAVWDEAIDLAHQLQESRGADQ